MVNRWGNSGNSDRLYFGGLQNHCSHEVKKHFLLVRKTMTNLDSILKSRDIPLLTKLHVVKAMVFPVVMYGCELDSKESWVQKNWCFEPCCWRRLLRVLRTAKRSNQSIPKEISPEYLLEGLMLKLKLQYFGHLIWRTDSLEKPWCWERLNAGGEGDNRGWDGWMASPSRWTWVWASSGSWWWTGKTGMLQSIGLQRVGHDWGTGLNWLNYWTPRMFSFNFLKQKIP